jgi:2-phospho-L-lactate guanylyltransferase
MWAVLPIIARNVKSGLAPSLSLSERRSLFRCMVQDVIAAVAAVPALDGMLVVTGDPDTGRLAKTYGADVLEEAGDNGHDVAVQRATYWLLSRGVSGLMQLPGDIPTVTSDELSDVLAIHGGVRRERRLFTISPSQDHDGSNCIVCTPPDVLSLKFGPNSFRRHLVRARRAGIQSQIVEKPGIALDIDNPQDLARLAMLPRKTRTHRFLEESGIRNRVLNSVSEAQVTG